MKPLGEVLTLSVRYLKDKGISSPRLVAETLLCHVLHKKRIDLYTDFEYPLEESELELFRTLLKRASLSEPPEYITGSVEFYHCTLTLSPDVLIPRQETEILTDMIAKKLAKENLSSKVLWDLCTGSGCIGISLKKKLPDLRVSVSDASEKALKIARLNGDRNGVALEYVLGDLLKPFAGQKANYVVCNPPYITQKEYGELDPSVKNYEPVSALVGGETGLEFYERLANELPGYLSSGAKVFLEIGAGRGEGVGKLFSSPFWKKKELLYDYAGHDRFFFLEIE